MNKDVECAFCGDDSLVYAFHALWESKRKGMQYDKHHDLDLDTEIQSGDIQAPETFLFIIKVFSCELTVKDCGDLFKGIWTMAIQGH